MHHGLFVARQVEGEIRVLLQSLADSSQVAVTENPETARKKLVRLAVPLDILMLKKPDNGLGCGKSLSHKPRSLPWDLQIGIFIPQRRNPGVDCPF